MFWVDTVTPEAVHIVVSPCPLWSCPSFWPPGRLLPYVVLSSVLPAPLPGTVPSPPQPSSYTSPSPPRLHLGTPICSTLLHASFPGTARPLLLFYFSLSCLLPPCLQGTPSKSDPGGPDTTPLVPGQTPLPPPQSTLSIPHLVRPIIKPHQYLSLLLISTTHPINTPSLMPTRKCPTMLAFLSAGKCRVLSSSVFYTYTVFLVCRRTSITTSLPACSPSILLTILRSKTSRWSATTKEASAPSFNAR